MTVAAVGSGFMRCACIGAGTIGHAWAVVFARAGLETRLYDSDSRILDSALKQIEVIARELQAHGLIADAAALCARVIPHEKLGDALRDVDYVQESIIEKVEPKQRLFRELDDLIGPATIVGSSTSEIEGSRFMNDLSGSGRYLVVHPINPPYLVPLVELCPTTQTGPDALAATAALMRRLGQAPITLRKEIKGFIANRLQVAVVGEALRLVGEGYCEARDVDIAISQGLGLRWSFMGPFETGHLNSPGGYLEYIRKFEPTLRSLSADLSPDYPWNFDLIEKIDTACRNAPTSGDIATMRLRRDRILAKLRRVLDRESLRPGR